MTVILSAVRRTPNLVEGPRGVSGRADLDDPFCATYAVGFFASTRGDEIQRSRDARKQARGPSTRFGA